MLSNTSTAAVPHRSRILRMPSLDPFHGAHQGVLVVIIGPTAVGKTEIAICLAERLNGEIVSADSTLFYQGMDIGTAKPGVSERNRVPHHLIDIALPDQNWSLAIFQQAAHQVIRSIQQRGKLPFLVGGTGQYVRAVIEGWELPRVQPDSRLRQALEGWAGQISALGLHNRLALLDPVAADEIDPTNLRRTVRALEVILSSGQRFSVQKRRSGSPYRTLQFGLRRPRSELYERIDRRIDQMISNGLIDEVKGLLTRGYSPDLPTLSSIGYREIIAYLQGTMTLEEAVVQMKRRTRVFVRRQANWFKEDDPRIKWFTVGEETVNQMETVIRQWQALL